jgi:hypothetical protein
MLCLQVSISFWVPGLGIKIMPTPAAVITWRHCSQNLILPIRHINSQNTLQFR